MVFVVDQDRQSLDPCHPAVARKLLKQGKAAIFRRYPFTIILKRVVKVSPTPHLRVKIDPGSKTTGLALVDDSKGRVLWAANLEHRGHQIRQRMLARRQLRRSRRSRKTRYRKTRYLNRRKPEGWLPPSLMSRVYNIITWVERLRRWAPVGAISMELVRFDTQKLQNPEISGVEYQQGTLCGYEVREYLLEKWGRRCAYCGATNVPLEIEHIIPKSRGGSDRVSNLALACRPCNQAKGNCTAAEFGRPEVQARAKEPLRDAATVNATRWALYRRLFAAGLPVEVGTGGRTKYNRVQLGLPKAHWTDAACVGESTPGRLRVRGVRPLLVRAAGHGNRQMCGTDRHGFPVWHRQRRRSFLGFRTGDFVRAVVPWGRHAGVHVGHVTIRFRPSFRLNGFDVHPKSLKVLQRADGYEYATEKEESRYSFPD